MIAVVLTELTSLSSTVAAVAAVAAEGDGGGLGWLLALGPAGAGAVYAGLWRFYRNTHTSHDFERETRIQAQPATGNDAKVDEVKGTKKSNIDGDNRANHRQRVQRF